MKKFLVIASALAATALTATAAQAVPATANATGQVIIATPLTITSTANFDLGTVVLSGPSGFSTTVGIDQSNALTCPAAAVTCSGTTSVAQYSIVGTPGATVSITVPDVTLNNGTVGEDLTLSVDAPTSLLLTSAAATATGEVFSIGGSIDLSSSTPEGVYTGLFNVSADYQ